MTPADRSAKPGRFTCSACGTATKSITTLTSGAHVCGPCWRRSSPTPTAARPVAPDARSGQLVLTSAVSPGPGASTTAAPGPDTREGQR